MKSFTDPKEASELIDCTAWYLKTYYGENDGLVEVKDQSVEGVGTPLVLVNTDHAGLTVSWPLSNSSVHLREALTKAILVSISVQ